MWRSKRAVVLQLPARLTGPANWPTSLSRDEAEAWHDGRLTYNGGILE